MLLARTIAVGFVAGFISVLIFHQGLWALLSLGGIIPPERPAWPLDPVPPFGLPSVLSKALWGGVWGAVLAPLIAPVSGTWYWLAWILAGAVALSLVAFHVVPPLKGEPIPALWPRFLVALAVNGAWGFGTALILNLMRRGAS